MAQRTRSKRQKTSDRVAKVVDPPAADGRKKRGRPSTFDAKRHCKLMRLGALFGADQAAQADLLGVSQSTLKTWLKTHPELAAAREDGRLLADAKVAGKLYRSAVGGGKRVATKTVRLPDGGTRSERTVERAMPSWKACLAWLERRAPGKWAPQAAAGDADAAGADILAAVAKMKAGISLEEGGDE